MIISKSQRRVSFYCRKSPWGFLVTNNIFFQDLCGLFWRSSCFFFQTQTFPCSANFLHHTSLFNTLCRLLPCPYHSSLYNAFWIISKVSVLYLESLRPKYFVYWVFHGSSFPNLYLKSYFAVTGTKQPHINIYNLMYLLSRMNKLLLLFSVSSFCLGHVLSII